MSALPGRRLERALTRAAGRAGVALAIEAHEEKAWSSATFVGARHALHASAASGEALSRWLEGIAAEEIDVPGHLIAELRLRHCTAHGAVSRFCVTGLTLQRD